MKQYSYALEDIERMGGMSRNWPTILPVTKTIVKYAEKNDKILDFGAGKEAKQTAVLREMGFKNVKAIDLYFNPEYHDSNALDHTYDVVGVSNVINCQKTIEEVIHLVRELRSLLKPGGLLIVNYTGTKDDPHRCCKELSNEKFEDILKEFYPVVTRERGFSCKMWVCVAGPSAGSRKIKRKITVGNPVRKKVIRHGK